MDTTCPVCNGPATLVPEDENTVYCKDSECAFMGILPE